jgi:hypothetical protein
MSGPPRIPSEVSRYIFDLATNYNRDVQTLANLCRVDRQCNAIARPRLYMTWTYHGEKHSFRSLWKFLCTIIRTKDIAALVQSVDARNWSHPNGDYSDEYFGTAVEASEEEVNLLKQAFRAAGTREMANCTIDDLKVDDRSPFIALLFTQLPNLSTMSAHLPHYDPFIDQVVSQALLGDNENTPMQAFQNLKVLSVVSEWARSPKWGDSRVDHAYYKLHVGNYRGIFNLPHLEALSIFDLDIEGLGYFDEIPRGTSSLKNLTLVSHEHLAAPALEIKAVLALPKALVNLSFYQNDCASGRPSDEDSDPISNAQLFSALEPQQKHLESLDVYRDCTRLWPPAHNDNVSHFGLLRGFDHLKNLSVQIEALLGGYNREPRAPFRLKDTLPFSLESLTVYGLNGLVLDYGLEEQFRETLLSGDFPHLKLVIFEDVSRFHHPMIQSFVTKPHEAVRELCKEARVTFQVQNGRHLLKGGKQSPWFKQACRMRRSWENKQEILTEYEDSEEDDSSDSRV